jgi:hypothetical protein
MAIIQGLGTPKRKSKEGFFAEYLAYTKLHESPEDFHLWVAMTLMAMTVKRNVWMNRGYYKLYPNIYTILVAESALLRKSSSIRIGLNLIKEAHPEGMNIFAQKITPEGLIHYLSLISEEQKKSEATIVSDELAVTLGNCAKDPTLLQLLTTLYDSADKFEYATISRGIEKCENICISMLAGSTPEWLKSSMPEDAVGGGFFSRLIIVNRLECGRRNPHPEDTITEELQEIRKVCVGELRAIGEIKGEFKWEPSAKRMFSDWYCDYNEPDQASAHLRGYYGRKGDTIIKLAMLCSLSTNDSLILTERDFNFALRLLGENETHLTDIINKMGQTQTGKDQSQVLSIIEKAGMISHSKLLQRVSYKYDKDMLRLICETLREAGQIDAGFDGKANFYCIKGHTLAKGLKQGVSN